MRRLGAGEDRLLHCMQCTELACFLCAQLTGEACATSTMFCGIVAGRLGASQGRHEFFCGFPRVPFGSWQVAQRCVEDGARKARVGGHRRPQQMSLWAAMHVSEPCLRERRRLAREYRAEIPQHERIAHSLWKMRTWDLGDSWSKLHLSM